MSIFKSTDEMTPDQRLAFELGAAREAEGAKCWSDRALKAEAALEARRLADAMREEFYADRRELGDDEAVAHITEAFARERSLLSQREESLSDLEKQLVEARAQISKAPIALEAAATAARQLHVLLGSQPSHPAREAIEAVRRYLAALSRSNEGPQDAD